MRTNTWMTPWTWVTTTICLLHWKRCVADLGAVRHIIMATVSAVEDMCSAQDQMMLG